MLTLSSAQLWNVGISDISRFCVVNCHKRDMNSKSAAICPDIHFHNVNLSTVHINEFLLLF